MKEVKKSYCEVAESTFCFNFLFRCLCTNLALRKLGLWKILWPVSEINKERFLAVLETSYEMSGIFLDTAVTVCPRAENAISFLPLSFLYIANSSGEVTMCTESVGRCCVALTGDSVGTENTKNKKLWVFIWNHRWPVALSKWIPDLCKLFMQLHGILSLFRDSVVTIIMA